MTKNSLIILGLVLILLTGCGWNSNDLSTKKQECLEYKEDILKQNLYDMTDVFYSPSLNTCIFVYWDYKISEDGTHYNTIHTIKDLFNDKVLFSQTNAPLWQEKVDELKK